MVGRDFHTEYKGAGMRERHLTLGSHSQVADFLPTHSQYPSPSHFRKPSVLVDGEATTPSGVWEAT